MLGGFSEAKKAAKTPEMKQQIQNLEDHFKEVAQEIEKDEALTETEKADGLEKLSYMYQQPEFNRMIILEAQRKGSLGEKTLEEATFEELSNYREELKNYLEFDEGRRGVMFLLEHLD